MPATIKYDNTYPTCLSRKSIVKRWKTIDNCRKNDLYRHICQRIPTRGGRKWSANISDPSGLANLYIYIYSAKKGAAAWRETKDVSLKREREYVVLILKRRARVTNWRHSRTDVFPRRRSCLLLYIELSVALIFRVIMRYCMWLSFSFFFHVCTDTLGY